MSAPKPVGAGDLGEVITHLRGAIDAFGHRDWASMAAHLRIVAQEALAAFQGGHEPHPVLMQSGTPDCCEEVEKLKAMAAEAEAGKIDWKALLATILPLLLRLLL